MLVLGILNINSYKEMGCLILRIIHFLVTVKTINTSVVSSCMRRRELLHRKTWKQKIGQRKYSHASVDEAGWSPTKQPLLLYMDHQSNTALWWLKACSEKHSSYHTCTAPWPTLTFLTFLSLNCTWPLLPEESTQIHKITDPAHHRWPFSSTVMGHTPPLLAKRNIPEGFR